MSEPEQEPKPLQEFTERVEKPGVKPPKPLPEEELKKFVLGMVDGQVFTSAHLNEHEMGMPPMVFMPLALGMFADHGEKEMKAVTDELGVFWEWMSQAGPRSVNGLPTFFSVRLLCRSDWQRARKAYQIEMDRRKNFVLPT